MMGNLAGMGDTSDEARLMAVNVGSDRQVDRTHLPRASTQPASGLYK